MNIPAYIIEKFGKNIDDIRKAKTEGKQESREIVFEVKQAEMDSSECQKLCKKIGVEYKEGYEERVIDYVCSDEDIDRMGDILKQKGWVIDNFKKNPVIMGFHNYQTYPVGNALKVKVIDGKLRMSNLFAGAEIDEEADRAFRFVKSGFMKAGSVGFMPIEYHYPDDKEREKLGMGPYGVVYDKMELLEFSVCGVPANAGALQESINKGLTTKKDFYGFIEPDVYDELLELLEPSEPETKEVPEPEKKELDENIKEQIAKQVQELLIEQKAGAKLSKKSKGSINKAITGMESAVTALKSLLEETESDESKNLNSFDIELDTADEDEEEYYPEGDVFEFDENN